MIHTNRFRGRTAPCPRVSPPSTLPALRAPRRAGSRFFQSIPPLRSCRLSASATRRYSPWEFRAPMRKNRLSRENRGRPSLRQHKPLTAKLPRAQSAKRAADKKKKTARFMVCILPEAAAVYKRQKTHGPKISPFLFFAAVLPKPLRAKRQKTLRANRNVFCGNIENGKIYFFRARRAANASASAPNTAETAAGSGMVRTSLPSPAASSHS